MNQLILRVLSSVMATAAVMLMGFAIVLATPGTSHAIIIAVCPAEPEEDENCDGTCSRDKQKCTDVIIAPPGEPEQDGCQCLPPKMDP